MSLLTQVQDHGIDTYNTLNRVLINSGFEQVAMIKIYQFTKCKYAKFNIEGEIETITFLLNKDNKVIAIKGETITYG